MAEYPLVDALYSLRRAVLYSEWLASSAELEAYLSERGVDYVLIAPSIEWQVRFDTTLGAQQEAFRSWLGELVEGDHAVLVHRDERWGVQVFQVLE